MTEIACGFLTSRSSTSRPAEVYGPVGPRSRRSLGVTRESPETWGAGVQGHWWVWEGADRRGTTTEALYSADRQGVHTGPPVLGGQTGDAHGSSRARRTDRRYTRVLYATKRTVQESRHVHRVSFVNSVYLSLNRTHTIRTLEPIVLRQRRSIGQGPLVCLDQYLGRPYPTRSRDTPTVPSCRTHRSTGGPSLETRHLGRPSVRFPGPEDMGSQRTHGCPCPRIVEHGTPESRGRTRSRTTTRHVAELSPTDPLRPDPEDRTRVRRVRGDVGGANRHSRPPGRPGTGYGVGGLHFGPTRRTRASCRRECPVSSEHCTGSVFAPFHTPLRVSHKTKNLFSPTRVRYDRRVQPHVGRLSKGLNPQDSGIDELRHGPSRPREDK